MTLPLNAQRPCPRYALRVLYFLPEKVFILRGPPSFKPPVDDFLAINIYPNYLSTLRALPVAELLPTPPAFASMLPSVIALPSKFIENLPSPPALASALPSPRAELLLSPQKLLKKSPKPSALA
jgi:hypothetical protein